MKIVSWNVNGIRASLKKGFLDQFQKINADVFCLQETKAQIDQVKEALEPLKEYHIYSNAAEQKGYSGTTIISRFPALSYSINIGVDEHDQEGRVVRTEFEHFNLVNVYVPNSGGELKRLDYRAQWDVDFKNYLVGLMAEKPLIVTGDFNVAHQPIDLARPKENYNKSSGYTQTEIDGFSNLLATGLVDTFRHLNPEKVAYTFWNQRFKARERNIGWRIDYFLVSSNLLEKVESSEILDNVMGSDHCPLTLDVNN